MAGFYVAVANKFGAKAAAGKSEAARDGSKISKT